MKSIIYILIASAFIFTGCIDNSGVSKAFSKYSHNKGVTSITVPGWIISIGSEFVDLSDEEKELLNCIDKVKILTVEDDDLNARINLHKEFHAEINKDKEYEELLSVRDKHESVTVFGKMNKDVIREMIVLVGGDDNVMIYVRGEIRPEVINNSIDLSNPERFLSMKF